VAFRSRVFEESQIKGTKHQHNADVYHQTFPKSVLEEQYVCASYNGYQHQNVNQQMDIPWHGITGQNT
jgi:hypothetical protein